MANLKNRREEVKKEKMKKLVGLGIIATIITVVFTVMMGMSMNTSSIEKDIVGDFASPTITAVSTTIDQIMSDAKLVEEVQTGSTVDLGAIINDSDFNATLQGDYAVWEEELDDYIFKGSPAGTPSCPAGVAGYSKSPITIKIAVSKDGLFYLGTFNGTAEDNLLIFSQNRGITNYYDFSGNLLDKTRYGEPHDVFLDLDARQNLLAYIFGEIYKEIYNKGYITSGPTDYYELYNCDYLLENRFNHTITVIRSFIYHQQFDYSWYNEKWRPIEEARNAKWSPIAKNPDQDRDLSRSFNVDYQDVSESFVWIRTHSDNGMHGDVTIYGMKNPPDYSCGGGDFRTWRITYDPDAKTYNVHNDNCAAAELFLSGQLPDKVQMEGHTHWSLFKTSATIAVLGDITTSDHTESPSPGDDNNPVPMVWRISPSPQKPRVSIYTDRTSYTTGDRMHLGLDVKNPLDSAQRVGLNIYLETPIARNITLIDRTVALPAGLNYSNPSFKVFKLPNIPKGTYAWHAILRDPVTDEIISEDTAYWEFVPTGATTEDFTEMLEQTTVIEFAE